MGRLVEGEWTTDWYTPDERGRFRRPLPSFRHRVGRNDRFPVEPGRYHLYVSYACPWAQRTLITRHVNGLQEAIGLSVVDPRMGEDGWWFGDAPGATEDHVNGTTFLRDVYRKADPRYTGRVTVPVLWDRHAATIVNNESREIMRMLNTDLRDLGRPSRDLLPAAKREEVDRVLDRIYEPINNGVYRAGFATSQEAYEEACRELFAALDHWEAVLGERRYLCGDSITEADVAMYTTLVRFDLVYYAHFKCNVRRIQDSPHLWGYLRDLYQTPGFGDTTRLDHIKTHYYWSQTRVNPTRIVPLGPTIDFTSPHGRSKMGDAS